MAVGDTVDESDGLSTSQTLVYPVTYGTVCYIKGFIGIAMKSGIAGDVVAFDIRTNEVQLEVPAALNVVAGDIIFIDVPNIGSNHMVPSAAFLKATATGARPWARCVENENTANVVRVIRFHGAATA